MKLNKTGWATLGVAAVLLVSWSPAVCFGQADTNKPAVSAGLEKCTTPAARQGRPFERYEMLNERVKTNGAEASLIFIGDSITQGWEGAGKDVWKKYYEPRHALNLGIGGDRTEHLLWRMDHGNLEGLHPKVAVVLIGVNNAPDEGNSPGDIFAGVKAVVEKLEQKLPETQILLLGIFPFKENFHPYRGKVVQINQALHRYADEKRVHFLDFGYLYLDTNGKIPKEMMKDFLHPGADGYKVWAKAMEPKLAKLLGDEAVKAE
jgi:lysophospholipase L1-like esterase